MLEMEGGEVVSYHIPLGSASLGMFCSLEGLSRPSGFCYATHYCAGGAVSPTPIKQKVGDAGYRSLLRNADVLWDHKCDRSLDGLIGSPTKIEVT